MSKIIFVVGDVFYCFDARFGVGGEFGGDDDIYRQRDIDAARAGVVEHRFGVVQEVGFVERGADVDAFGGEEGVSNAAAGDKGIDFFQQRLQHEQFGRDF